MQSDHTASVQTQISREDYARLNQAAARHGTCASDLLATLIHHVLARGVPPEVEAALEASRARREAP